MSELRLHTDLMFFLMFRTNEDLSSSASGLAFGVFVFIYNFFAISNMMLLQMRLKEQQAYSKTFFLFLKTKH